MMFEKKPEKHFPDRPLECGECKKPITIRYTEISREAITHTAMCSDCPELLRRLHGTNPRELVANRTGTAAGLECGNCGTTLDEIKRGHPLGCAECYSVFEEVLFIELQQARCLPPRILPLKKSHLVHLGRIPGERLAINASSKLLALNEALIETLGREDYEQAALLRDQIKSLTENENLESQREEKKNESPGKE